MGYYAIVSDVDSLNLFAELKHLDQLSRYLEMYLPFL